MPTLKFLNMFFEWHDDKAELVLSKRGITLEEVASVFADFNAIQDEDIGEYGEVRYITIGMSNQGRLLAVIWTQRQETFRIITSYFPTKHQQRSYSKYAR